MLLKDMTCLMNMNSTPKVTTTSFLTDSDSFACPVALASQNMTPLCRPWVDMEHSVCLDLNFTEGKGLKGGDHHGSPFYFQKMIGRILGCNGGTVKHWERLDLCLTPSVMR